MIETPHPPEQGGLVSSLTLPPLLRRASARSECVGSGRATPARPATVVPECVPALVAGGRAQFVGRFACANDAATGSRAPVALPSIVHAHRRGRERVPIASRQSVFCILVVPHDLQHQPLVDCLLAGSSADGGDDAPDGDDALGDDTERVPTAAELARRNKTQQNRTHILIAPDPVYAVYVRNCGRVTDLRMRRETPRWRIDVVLGPFDDTDAAADCAQRWLEGTRGRVSKRQRAPALARTFGVQWYAYEHETIEAHPTRRRPRSQT